MNKYLAGIVTTSSIAFAGIIIAPTEAKAVTITLDGTDYEVTTILTSFDDNETLLESQPWWGNDTFAESAAEQVGLNFGFTNGFGTRRERTIF